MKAKKIVVCSVICAAVILSAGCRMPSYELYTNMPQGSYEIKDGSYKLGGFIEGYSAGEEAEAPVGLDGYSSAGFRYFSMMADAELVVSADFNDEEVKNSVNAFAKTVGNELNAIDKALSTTVADSDISLFNNARAGERVEISQITYEVLSQAKAAHEFTDGYYNPALYYNIFAYGFGGAHSIPETADELPSDDLIAKYTDLASHFGEIELLADGGKYFAQKPAYTVEVDGESLSLKLDLGGIGKGYAVDRVDAMLDENGYKYGYFSFGSSSITIKSHFKNGSYRMGFGGPRSPSRDPYIETPVRNEKVSSSGDNEQFYVVDGTRYCHIIDPATGKPVQTGIMSVTVIGGSAAQADALTTAIMAMGKERAAEFIKEKLTDMRVVFTCGN